MLDKFYCAVPSEQNCSWGHHDIVTPTFGKLRRVAMVSLSLSLLLRLRSFGFGGFGWQNMAKYCLLVAQHQQTASESIVGFGLIRHDARVQRNNPIWSARSRMTRG